MPRSIMWTRSWSPFLCLIFYFTTVAWLVPWNTVIADPDPAANISPDIKSASEDLSNDELHALLSLLAGTNTKVNPPDTILLSDPLTTTEAPKLVTVTSAPVSTSSTTPIPPSTTSTQRPSSVATTTSAPPTTTKPRVIIVPVTPATTTTTQDPKHNPRGLGTPPQNDLAQLLTSLLGGQSAAGGSSQPQGALDHSAAAEAAAALFGVAPAALIIPTTTTTTTTTTPRPPTTVKPIGTLDDTSAALQSLALLNVLLGNTGENSGNNSAAAALLGLGTAASSPAVRQTHTPHTPQSTPTQKEQEAYLTNLLLQSAAAGAGGQGNPSLQNFVNQPSSMDASASNQLSGLLGILGTLGNLGGQQQQNPGLFNLGQGQQQQQQSALSNIFAQPQRHNPQAQQQANLLTSLFGGNPTTPAPSLPGLGILASMANLGSTIFSTVTNTFGGSRGDGRPRVRGVDTRLGLGYRFGDNADAQLMWEIGPQLFTEPLKNDESVARKRQAGNGHGLLGSASGRVFQMFKPQSQYPQNNPHHDNPPWRRADTVDESIVSKESLASVASSLPHQSLKTLHALLDMKNKFGTTPATTPESQRRSSLFSWYSSTTPTPRKIHIPAQQVGPPTSKFDMFNWFNQPTSTSAPHPVQVPSTQMTPPKFNPLDKLVSWYMGGSSNPSTTEAVPNSLDKSIDPNNFLKRSSLSPISPTARSMMRNYYDKRQINPKTNIHSSLTTYEKYLLGILNEDDMNKSQDMETLASSNQFHQGNNHRGNSAEVSRRPNLRNGNNFSGERRQIINPHARNNGMHLRRNGFARPPLTNAPFLERPVTNNPNFMQNRRPNIGNQFNFESHNKIVTMKGNGPQRLRRPPPSTTLRPPPPGMGPYGMRRRFGPQKPPPPPFSNRKSGFSFSSLNPFSGLFGKKNRPHNNFMHNQRQHAPIDQSFSMTETSSTVDSYNPYGNYDPLGTANTPNNNNNFDSYGSNSQSLENIRNILANIKNRKVKDESAQEEDTPTAASNAQPTKAKYNPHQNFIPEAEDSYLRRNAIVGDAKLRAAEIEKILGGVKDKNSNSTEKAPGQSNRKSDDDVDVDHDPESPTKYLMGLVKNVLNTRLKAKINNKDKNIPIPSISVITDRPMLPTRPKQNRQRIRTKLKITNGKPEIVVVPEPEAHKEEKPIVHVGEDMSFEDLKEFYDGVVTTTKKPKPKKKKPKLKTKKTELVISDDDEIELSEEEEDGKEVFIDIDSGEVSVLKPVASLTAFEPPKEDSPEEEDVHLDEETKRKQEIYQNLQKQLQFSYEKMKKAQLRALAKQKRKEELAAKGLDESLDMVSKYFDLVEEPDKVDGKTHHDPQRQESQRHPYLSPPPPYPRFNRQANRNHNDHQGYTSNTSYSRLRKNRKRRRRAVEMPILF